jgi:hypothetical protein
MVLRKRFSAFTSVVIGRKGWLRLVGAVGAAEALNGGVRLPAGLEQVVNPQPAIPRREFGVVASPRAAGIAEDEDALGIIHEGSGLGEIGRGGAVLDHQLIALTNDAARAARNLRDHVRAEALNDLVERARHGRQRGELFDQSVAARNGFTAFDRLAVT